MPSSRSVAIDANALRPPGQTEPAAVAGIISAGFAFTLVLGWQSEGFHHADGLTHYLIARWAWNWPSYLLDAWGRPGFTCLYFLPAAFGAGAARVWSALLSALTAWLAFLIARRVQVRRAWLVPLFLYLQPRFVTLATTTLTETAAMVYLTAAVYLALRHRWRAAAALLSLAIVARHEAVALIPIFAIAIVAADRPLWRLWPVLWAPLAVNGLAWAVGMTPAASLYLRPAASGLYGRGGWYEMFSRTLEAFGPALAALGFAGARTLARKRGGLFVAACALTWFAVQAFVRLFGLYDSGGYARFLVPFAPLWAVMAAAAWDRLLDPQSIRRARMALAIGAVMAVLCLAMELHLSHRDTIDHRTHPHLKADVPRLGEARNAVRVGTVAVIAAAVAVIVMHGRTRRGIPAGAGPLRFVLATMMALTAWVFFRPLERGPAERLIDAELAWLRENGMRDRPVLSAHVWCAYRTDTALPRDRPGLAARIAAAPAGAIVLWERQFAVFNESPPVELKDLSPPHFRPLTGATGGVRDGQTGIWMFEKLSGSDTAVGLTEPRP